MRYLWYSMYGFATALALYSLLFRPTPVDDTPPHHPAPVAVSEKKIDVQIALVLDTSSSMDGLVAQARAQLWEIVAEMQVDSHGRAREVAVALYQYGNSRLSPDKGFLEQITPLTTDFDLLAARLETLSTSGGQEYAPLAVHRALQELQWDSDDNVERIIVVAGNENFNQGPLGVEAALREAQTRKVRVIPIYCANKGTTRGALESWKRASTLAGMDFQSIDPDQAVAEIESPYDHRILEKYRALEETNGVAADASRPSASLSVDRAVVYSRQGDAACYLHEYEGGGQVPTAALPAEVKSRSPEAQERYLQQQVVVREQLKQEIEELNEQRQEHIRKNAPQQSRPASFGSVFKESVR